MHYSFPFYDLPWRANGACLRPVPLTLAISLLGMSAAAVAQEVEQPDRFRFNAGIGHTWDSNYDRVPDDDPEQISTANAGVRINQELSRQRFTLSAGATRYEHDERDNFDTTTWGGGAAWKGTIGNAFKPHLSWSRRERLVDRAEFEDKDVVTEEETTGGLVITPGNNWSFPLTLRRLDQAHSNDSQEALDYTDEEASVGTRYTSARGSTIGLKVINGQREYPHQDRVRPEDIPESGDLDFDYTTVEFETNWVVSPKTQLESRLGMFDRDGEANDGTGGYALLEGRWAATYKTHVTTGFEYTEPAIGETSDSASEIQRFYLDLEWQATPKILLGTGYAWLHYEFDANPQRDARSERIHKFTPLTARYQATDTLELNLRTVWLDRSSPLDEREFDASIVSLGLDLTL
ncbi:hypothetical protein [Marinobacter segnicrescens]|uniref:Beta-barrel porin 2 n=1 Tax=Marinobacter segnicrescens TaxID=430453 RepID=A0A1I0AQQ4_9GAMM|nr:hypothetical protein [Marinobacter segnicrescens]SES95796.1 hypothetical protein SAMN04487962_10342 [Marinobacter segnicrescens]